MIGHLFGRPEDAVYVVIFVVIALVGIASFVWQLGAGKRMLERWARENGFQLLEAKRPLFWNGPFWWRTAQNQLVYRIAVRDAGGQERTGWARCGGWFMGMHSYRVDVEWDRPPDEPPGFPVIMPAADPRPLRR